MRRPPTWLGPILLLVTAACGDGGGTHVAPDTVLDEVPAALSNETHLRITFHAEGNANTFQCALDGQTPSTCVSPFEIDTIEGAHTFEVAAGLGTTYDDTPATHDWRIDATAPDTMLLMVPAALDNTVDPSLTFSGADPGGGPVTFECKLDGGAFAACITPDQLNLADGAHAFEVRAVDQAGNVDPTPATHAWTVDSSTPDTAITSGPAAGTTTAPDVMFAFSSPVAATFECALDGGAFAACTSPQPYTALADGDHTFAVRAKNSTGTVNPTPASRTWTVDGTPPTVTITSHPVDPSNDAMPAFGFTSPDATATFACQIDGVVTFMTCTSAWTSPALVDGSHTFRVRATDPTGNTGPEATFTWTQDTMAPAVTITSGPNGLVASATAIYTFTTGGAPIATECSLDAGAFTACTSPTTYTGLPDAMHTFVVRVRDAAGNTGMDMRTFTVDTMPPVVTITSGPTGPTSDPTPTFGFTVTGGVTIECSTGGAFAACTSPFTSGALADGPYTFTVRAFDAAGNVGSSSRMFTVDTMGPTVTITGKPANPTNSPSATFTFTVSEGSPQCKLDAGAFAPCSSGVSYPGLGDGSHTFTVQAMDAAGNPGSASYTWTIDTMGPTVTITSSPPNPTAMQTPTIGFTVSADAVSATCRTDALPATACAAPAYTTPALGDGSHTITITALDAVGNPGSASVTFTVDTTGPVVTFDEVPPAAWPVNYFDVMFHANEPATFECSLNGAAFAACASGISIITVYGTASTFTVRAKDALGNLGGNATTTWTSTAGLVLHYPWEQGSTRNTSLLAQVAADSPDGSATLSPVGGWAGTAARAPAAHTYPGTARALSSSATGTYTGSAWLRVTSGVASGVLWSTANGTTGGHRVILSGTTVTLQLFQGGQTFTATGSVTLDKWSNVAVYTTGPAKGAQLLIDGVVVGTAAPPTATGFGAGQAPDLTVGALTGADLDDLRFYNVALTGGGQCTTLVRGVFDATGLCVPMRPGFELDFEGPRVVNSGTFAMTIQEPTTWTAFVDTLGSGLKVGAGALGLALTGYANAPALPGHSIALWVQGGSPSDTLLDFTRPCSFLANLGTCGVSIALDVNHQLSVFTGTGLSVQKTTVVPASPLTSGPHSLVLAEQRSGTTTTSVKLYVDGRLEATVAIGTGDLFGIVNDKITMVSQAGAAVDEYELWPRDVAANREMLCENGFDGTYDPATDVCTLTSN